jgi:hypothetical protein
MGIEDRQVVAVVAYLMRLGTDIYRPAPEEGASAPAGIATTAEADRAEGGQE